MRLGWEEIDCIFVDMDDVDLPVMIPDLDIYRSAHDPAPLRQPPLSCTANRLPVKFVLMWTRFGQPSILIQRS